MKVVYHCFGGRYGDNPRALYEALAAQSRPLEHVWLADERHAAGFPASVASVPVDGAAGREALESADLLISNTHVEVEWDKPATCTYLQTWHGTPLKRIHFDVRWAPEGRLEQLTHDVRRWDGLLSPNAASTGPLRAAFGYDGEVLESGYPRNDVLVDGRAPQVRARLRAILGIPADAPVVLYAPTWRDDLTFAQAQIGLQLDVEALTRRLPDAHVLLRLHYLDTGRLVAVDLPRVHDMSFHPEISELYCAADALVTDYSSVMFDFAVTGRPVVLFAYDLEHYRDTLRGFYYDLAEIAPGPVLATSEQVVDALADLPGLQRQYAGPYAAFRERFCALEDGKATARVLERFLP